MKIKVYASKYNINLFKDGLISFRDFMRRTDEKLNDERNHTWKKYMEKDIPIKIIIPDIDKERK